MARESVSVCPERFCQWRTTVKQLILGVWPIRTLPKMVQLPNWGSFRCDQYSVAGQDARIPESGGQSCCKTAQQLEKSPASISGRRAMK